METGQQTIAEIMESHEAMRRECDRLRAELAAAKEYHEAYREEMLEQLGELAALKAGDVVMVLGLCRSALRHAHLKLTPNSPTERYVWEALNKADEVLAAAPGVQAGEKDNAEVNGGRLADRPSEAV